MPQLDSLRTIAVGLVILHHWYPTGVGINRLPNGTIGVMIFFVISGFLITRILLQARQRVDDNRAALWATYRTFFIRRALRIFPLYYLVITVFYIGLPSIQQLSPDVQSDIQQHPLYYYLYGYNILLHQTGHWADILSPFWTLGVEEQLYLIWPWFVLLVPKRLLGWLPVGLVAVGLLSRIWGYFHGDIEGLLMPGSADAFGLGAIWAWLTTARPAQADAFRKRLPYGALLALLAFAGLQLLPGDNLLTVVFMRFLVSVMALYVIAGASRGFGGIGGIILNNSILQYVGRISYGVYVFHMIVPGVLMKLVYRVMNRLHLPTDFSPNFHRLFALLAVIAVASASYYVLEKPINNLKKRISY